MAMNLLEKKRSLSPAITEEVRVVDITEYEGAAQCLAEAFATDEVARYFVDTDDMSSYSENHKWKLHCDIIKYMTAAHCYKGIVTTIGPNYDAVALWYIYEYPSFPKQKLTIPTGCPLVKTWTTGSPISAAVCGNSTFSSPAKAASVSTMNSCRSYTTPSTTSWATATPTSTTSCISAVNPAQEVKAMRRNSFNT